MNNELDQKKEAVLQTMMQAEILPVTPEMNIDMRRATKIPLADLAALGVAFQPLMAAIQIAVNGSGGSGLYYVNTKGKQMFQAKDGEGFIAALKDSSGGVGGGQARITNVVIDPTMLFMAATLMNIERKLNTIQQTQENILQFLEEKERATIQGNLNVLEEVMTNFKYNWNNEKYKTNKHILVQQIKKEAEASIILYREQIGKRLKKRSLLHGNFDANNALNKLEAQFKDYQLALYIYAYSAFLEVMLLGNFDEAYLDDVKARISDYAYQYRTLYTEGYNLMEDYLNSSIQAGMLNGLATASKFMGNTIAKMPVISRSQIDENLLEAGDKLDAHGEQRTALALGGLAETRANVTLPFVEHIKEIDKLYNQPVQYLIDGENLCLLQLDA